MSVCPCCESLGRRVKDVNGYTLHKCTECECEYCFDMPTEETLTKFYAAYSDPLASESVARLNALRNADALRLSPGKVLDWGCGDGVFARTVGARGEDPYRQPVVSSDDKFDWITLWGVLEHLTMPYEDLLFLHRRLENNGSIALTTVSIETPIPYRHKPPEHTLYFTRKSIEALADRSGFRVAEYRPYRMIQDSDVYLDTLLRTMPDEYQALVTHSMPKYVEIPTNEVFVVLEKV